jgi:hypothetical protein
MEQLAATSTTLERPDLNKSGMPISFLRGKVGNHLILEVIERMLRYDLRDTMSNYKIADAGADYRLAIVSATV